MIHPDATVDECMEEIGILEAEIERLSVLNAELLAAAHKADQIISAWLAHQYSNAEQYPKLRETRDSLRRAGIAKVEGMK